MKTLKQFTNWWNKTGEENKKKEIPHNDYTPSKDVYQPIHEIRNEAKKIYEQNSDRIKSMSTFSGGYLSGSMIGTSSYINPTTIATTNLGSSAITIDGGLNGSMRVNVPLIVSDRDVMKELDEMRDSLLLLKRDVNMEEKYPRLKQLKDEYERALEKYKTFDILKESK